VPSPDVAEVVAVAAASTAQRHRTTEQWRHATAAWRARRRIRDGTEALVHPLRGSGIRLGPVLAGIVVGWMAGIVVGWMAGRWLGAIVGAFIGNEVGRSLLDHRRKDLDYEALCRELDRAALGPPPMTSCARGSRVRSTRRRHRSGRPCSPRCRAGTATRNRCGRRWSRGCAKRSRERPRSTGG